MLICAYFAALRPDLPVGQVWTRMGSAPLARTGRAGRPGACGGLSRHGAPPPRPNPTDSLGFAVQRAAPTLDIRAQHAEKSSCLRQTVLRGPFP